jgi:hypothetical protein
MIPDKIVHDVNASAEFLIDATANSLAHMEIELDALMEISANMRSHNLEGGREMALAITNIEQGLFWLKAAKAKM